jgi:hypothetical protein
MELFREGRISFLLLKFGLFWWKRRYGPADVILVAAQFASRDSATIGWHFPAPVDVRPFLVQNEGL